MSRPEANTPPPIRTPKTARAKQSVPISVFLGVMLVPLAAAASLFLVKPQIQQSTAAAAASPASSEGVPLEEDLIAACGPIGLEMTELEKSGSLTELQRAALDALRPICSQEGIPLPEPGSTQTVQAVLTSTASNGSIRGGSDDTWDDDDDWDDSDDDDWDDSDDDDWDDDDGDDDDRDDDDEDDD
jgi:hypothetical protein